MAKTDRLQVRIDPETKRQATELFDGLDMTVSDAVTLFIRQSLMSGGLPFAVDLSRKTETYARNPQIK